MTRGALADHALVVGGTGMLHAASVELAARSRVVTAVARRERALRRLADAGAERGGRVRIVAQDYRDTDGLRRVLDAAVVEAGRIDLALCWIHSVAPDAPVTVAGFLDGGDRPARFFHVLPYDAVRSAARSQARRDAIVAAGELTYHEVVLGAVDEGAGSRWLTHSEISGGTLEALEQVRPRFVIGEADVGER